MKPEHRFTIGGGGSVTRVSYQPVRFSVTFYIIDPFQFGVCCIRSGVTLYIHFLVHCICLSCQCPLHVVHWPLIGILMQLLATKHRRTFIPHSESLWNDLGDSGRWCGLVGFSELGKCFSDSQAICFYLSLFSLSLS